MNRSEDSEVRQGSRIVTAARRQAVAREKARITGKKARQPSALEQAAVEWERQQEAKVREVKEERLKISQVQICPFSSQQVSLVSDGVELPEDDMDWKPYNPDQEKEEKKGAAIAVMRKANMAGVGALSRRLMAMERARALGRKPVDPRAYALEQAARCWAEERTGRK